MTRLREFAEWCLIGAGIGLAVALILESMRPDSIL